MIYLKYLKNMIEKGKLTEQKTQSAFDSEDLSCYK